MKPSRLRYVQMALSLINTPYIWGGRSRAGIDCSGVPALALYEASDGDVDLRKGWWTDRFWNELPETVEPLPGDLVFYGGEAEDDVSHVMLSLIAKSTWAPGGLLFGASGGDHTTTSFERAMEQHAIVTTKPGVFYRAGFRGFRSIAPYLLEVP